MIHADTEGLLDKCHCGAVAGFEHMGGFSLRARCTECCEQTEPDHHVHPVVIEWTMMQREKKSNPGHHAEPRFSGDSVHGVVWLPSSNKQEEK